MRGQVILSGMGAATGERHWMERLGPKYGASPVAAGGIVYATSSEGVTSVIRLGPEFDLLGECKLGEPCSSSPAISGGRLFLRGHEHLFGIGGGAE